MRFQDYLKKIQKIALLEAKGTTTGEDFLPRCENESKASQFLMSGDCVMMSSES